MTILSLSEITMWYLFLAGNYIGGLRSYKEGLLVDRIQIAVLTFVCESLTP